MEGVCSAASTAEVTLGTSIADRPFSANALTCIAVRDCARARCVLRRGSCTAARRVDRSQREQHAVDRDDRMRCWCSLSTKKDWERAHAFVHPHETQFRESV